MQHDNMFQGSIGGPVLQHDGAVQSGRGKYRLQFLGSENPKEITKKVVIGVVALVAALLVITSLLSGKQPKDFPNMIELRNSIGLPLEEAALKAGVKLTDMTEKEPGVFLSNKGIILDNVAFDLYFYARDGVCSGFAYVADYKADPKKASKDIFNTLINLHIKTFDAYPNVQEGNVTYEVTKRNIQKYLDDGNVLLVKHTYHSVASDYDFNDPVGKYMADLEASESWEGRVGEYVTRKAALYVDKGAAYEPESQRVRLVLSYRVEPEREVKYGG